MRMTWILTGVLVLMALAVPFVLSVIYAEVEDAQPGTLDYWIGVPDMAKRVPVVTACGPTVYSHRAAQAGQPEMSTVTYRSESTAGHVSAVIAESFVAEGCRRPGGDTPGTTLTCGETTMVRIATTDGSPCNSVTVEISDPGRR